MSDAEGDTAAALNEPQRQAVLDPRAGDIENVQPRLPVMILLLATVLSIVVAALIAFASTRVIPSVLREIAKQRASRVEKPLDMVSSAWAPVVPRSAPLPWPSPTPGQKARVVTNLAEVFTPDYYPADAKRAGVQGRTAMRLSVDVNGAVTDCRVAQSSGSDDLDAVTCRLAIRDIRFAPARDQLNRPVASIFPLAVRWELRDS